MFIKKTLPKFSVRDLFEAVDNRVVIDFIKDIRSYSVMLFLTSPYFTKATTLSTVYQHIHIFDKKYMQTRGIFNRI